MVSTYPSEKWWSESQLGFSDIPNIWKNDPFMFQTTNQYIISIPTMVHLDINGD